MFKNPDFIIGEPSKPYLLRWYITPWSGWWRTDSEGKPRTVDSLNLFQRLIRTLPNVYVHKFMRSDDDRALHDHPWASASIILKGGYLEHTPEGVFLRKAGRVYFRGSQSAHRVQLKKRFAKRGQSKTIYAWTLFITGFKVREWGFHCPKEWVHWTIFTDTTDAGSVGKGCGE